MSEYSDGVAEYVARGEAMAAAEGQASGGHEDQ